MNDFKKFIGRYCFIQGVGGLIAGFIAPIMYVVLKGKGFEIIEIGLLILTSAVTTIIFEVPCGALSDKFGRKQLFLIGQFFSLIFCYTMFASNSLTLLFAAMFCAGLSSAMISGTLDALFVSRLNKESNDTQFLQISIAKAGLFNMLGMFFGALLSGVLLKDQVVSNNPSGFEINYGIVVCLLPVYMLLVFSLIKGGKGKNERNMQSRQRFSSLISNSFKEVAKHRTLKSLMLSSSAAVIAYVSLEKFWQLKLLDIIGYNDLKWVFGVLFASTILIGAFGQALSSILCRAFNNNYVHTLVFIRVLQGSLFLLLSISDGIASFIAVFVCIHFVSALSHSPVLTLFHSEIDDSKRSTMLSFRSIFIQAGATLGIVIASLISQYISLSAAFVVSGIIYFISIALLFLPSVTALGYKLSKTNSEASEPI